MAEQTYGQDNSWFSKFWGIFQPSQNVGSQFGALQSNPNPRALQVTAAEVFGSVPMFGRPGWQYVNVQAQPRIGPQPRLVRGTGKTARGPSESPLLGGFASHEDYHPQGMEYDPAWVENRMQDIPKTINTGDDGIELLGTYRAHDFIPAQRIFSHKRMAPMWEEMVYPADWRNLLRYKQVQKYLVSTRTESAYIIPQASYFLGYVTNPQVGSQLNQTGLGYMGSQ